MAKTVFSTVFSMPLDPEEEAFRALKATICSICRKRDISNKDDVRLCEMVDRYKERYPSLTPQSIEDELRATASQNSSPIDSLEIDDGLAYDVASALTCTTTAYDLPPSRGEGTRAEDYDLPPPEPDDGESPAEEDRFRCSAFAKICGANDGYNPVTHAFLLASVAFLAFLTSLLLTYLNYNTVPYRDWALAGGVTSTSAEFRVRGPASDDGKRREFVVSASSNLAYEKERVLVTPVSFGDFAPEEHHVKRLSLDDLEPSTTYHYGITRPQLIPNSAVVAGDVGSFTTPAPEGRRMDFTIAAGSCALTGSQSGMFASILDLDPLLFVHMGDLHYEDLSTLDVDDRLEAYDKVMGSPSQRLLYMRTIFSYIWDDHDWLGNNRDSEDEDAAAIAKQAYSLGIPHYGLGSTSFDEASAAKYQAFTIGTVRFVITDLRSESVRSSEYYSGKVYSKEQKQWLFDEFSRAGDYDFVVWVTSRPWTNPAELGSDSWGGFVPDRDELSAHIASTIGAGPRNLLVLSGDNHMVAFDDGSSTDYSGQDEHPGGFPILHSGPLTNYGGVKDFFNPKPRYFTDGCMAFSAELNHQFSTVDFYFPSDDDRGCVRMRSYSGDSSNVIFEREMCGDLMTRGTPERDTCTLKRMWLPTRILFLAAAALVALDGALALWFLGPNGCHAALAYFGSGALFYLLTVGAAGVGALCFGTSGVNVLVASAFVLSQSIAGSLFVGRAVFVRCTSRDSDEKSTKSGAKDLESGVKGIGKVHKVDMEAIEEDGAATHADTDYDTHDGSPTPPVMDARESTDNSASSETREAASVEGNSRKSADISVMSGIGRPSTDKSESKESTDNSAPPGMGETTIDESGGGGSAARSAAAETGGIGDRETMENSRATESADHSSASTVSADYSAAPEMCGEIFDEPALVLRPNGSIPPKTRKTSDDSSAPAVLCGSRNSSFEDRIASVLSSARNVSLPGVLSRGSRSFRDFVEGPSATAFEGGRPYRELEEAVASVVSGNAFFPYIPDENEEEGIEVTNPTGMGTRVRVAPELVEL